MKILERLINNWEIIDDRCEVRSKDKVLCRCSCGKVKYVIYGNILKGKSTSCKHCCKRVLQKMEEHRLYSIWKSMKTRCYNKNSKDYINYGGRGIVVAEYWKNDFWKFVEDMYSTFKEGLKLDRINNDGNYTKENCRWATPKEQSRNTRRNVMIIHEGLEYTEKDFSITFNIPRTTVQSRRNKGYTPFEIINGRK